jgi:hypothetical protein
MPSSSESPLEAHACDVPALRRSVARKVVAITVAIVVAVGTIGLALGIVFIHGVVPLSGFEARIADALRARLGPTWRVEVDHAEISREEGKSLLLVRGVSFQHEGGTLLKAPEAVLGYEPLALLRGDVQVKSVELRGLKVRVGIDQDGGINLNTGASTVRLPSTVPDNVAPNPKLMVLSSILSAIDVLTDEAGPLLALESAALARASLTLVDPQGREKIGLDSVDLRFRRLSERNTLVSITGANASGLKDLSLTVTSDAQGGKQLKLDINRIALSDMVMLGAGSRHIDISGVPITGTISLAGMTAADAVVSLDLLFSKGSVRLPDVATPPLAIDLGRIVVEGRNGLTDLDFKTIDLRAGDLKLAGTARGRHSDDGILALHVRLAGQWPGEGVEPPVKLTRLDHDIRADGDVVRIDAIAIEGPVVSLAGNGQFRRVNEDFSHDLSLNATRTDAKSLLALWPPLLAPLTRRALEERLDGGTVDTLRLDSNQTIADFQALKRGEKLPDSALKIDLTASGIRFRLAPGLPPLSNMSIAGIVTAQTMRAVIPVAKAELDHGRSLALSDGTLTILDTWVKQPIATTAFRSTGSMESLTAFLSLPMMQSFSPLQIANEIVRGSIDLRSSLTLPLGEDVAAQDVFVQSSGMLSNVSSDTLLAPEKLEAATFAVNYDKGSFSLRGEGKVGGERAQIEARQGTGGIGEASLTLTLDQAARQRRGFGFENQVSGPVGVKISKSLGVKSATPVRIEVDLARATIEGLLPGWNKAAGRPGKLSFNWRDDATGTELEDFILDSAPVNVRGKISLSKKSGFESASLTSFKLSPGDDLKVDAKQDGGVLKLTIRGAVADARPFLKDVSGAPGPPRSPPKRSPGTDYDIDLAVPILAGFNAETIGNAALKISKRGREVRQFSLDGRIGRNAVSGRLGRRPDGAVTQVTLRSADGGALLRYLDIYNRAFGGDLALTVTPDDDQQIGDILMRDFVVRNEPALQRVVSEQVSATNTDRAAGSTTTITRPRTDQVTFAVLQAGFSRSQTRLDIRDAALWGPQVGFTLQGSVDYARDRIDVAGTYIPGYAFNNAFSQMPIVGQLLGGGRNEGLFAINFRVTGSASAPTTSVNPLSAIAPGILRRFVDPLGGAPRGSQPADREALPE